MAAKNKSEEIAKAVLSDNFRKKLIEELSLSFTGISDKEAEKKADRIFNDFRNVCSDSSYVGHSDLMSCTPRSFQDSILKLAIQDFSLNHRLGLVWLKPGRYNKAQIEVGVRGWMNRLTSSGLVKSIDAEVVFKGEPYKIKIIDGDKSIEHEIDFSKRQEEKEVVQYGNGKSSEKQIAGRNIIGAYCVITLSDGRKKQTAVPINTEAISFYQNEYRGIDYTMSAKYRAIRAGCKEVCATYLSRDSRIQEMMQLEQDFQRDKYSEEPVKEDTPTIAVEDPVKEPESVSADPMADILNRANNPTGEIAVEEKQKDTEESKKSNTIDVEATDDLDALLDATSSLIDDDDGEKI